MTIDTLNNDLLKAQIRFLYHKSTRLYILNQDIQAIDKGFEDGLNELLK